MASIQTTIPFRVQKKATSFYSAKKALSPIKTDSNLVKNEAISQPKVKKLVELDSDDENIDISNMRDYCRNNKRKSVPVKRRKSYDTSEDSSSSDCSPRKISRVRKSEIVKPIKEDSDENSGSENYHNARCALHTAAPTNLPGREVELKKLEDFLCDHLEKEKSGTLYVSGPPGTGKTACLTKILQHPQVKKGYKEIYVNCTTMKSASSIYNKICLQLNLKPSASTEKAYLKAIDKYLSSKHNMILLVLDEIDQLSSKKQSVLYTIFEWPSRIRSKMVLVGIANALDLTDRILPRLNMRYELKPQLMHFTPYNKDQIIEIFTQRLTADLATGIFSPAAIQILAAKVAAVSGDVRRALDIGRRVVELSTPKKYLRKQNGGKDTNTTVELSQVMTVLNNVYGASQKLEDEVDDCFPLQQKLLLCSLLLMLNKGKHKDITVGKLYDVYVKVCKKRNLANVDHCEFFNLCELVETRGIIRLSGRKDPRTHKVTLQWDEAEVGSALKDKQMMSEILNDVSPLGL